MAVDPTTPEQPRYGFQKGVSGNPAGRPKGTRNKLGELFLTALYKSFEANGPETLERVRVEDPSAYCKVVASLLPKEVSGPDGEPLVTGITVTFVKPKES